MADVGKMPTAADFRDQLAESSRQRQPPERTMWTFGRATFMPKWAATPPQTIGCRIAAASCGRRWVTVTRYSSHHREGKVPRW